MPPVAWSAYGEIRQYSDIKALDASGAPGTVLPKQDVLELRRAYYASVTQTDFMLGKVMAELKASPFASNTVVSIWGDHGWQLGEHGEWCKHTNFEFATRAPMMIHVPGLTDAGILSSAYSEHVRTHPPGQYCELHNN
jgi:iduronate 2-sulfatase